MQREKLSSRLGFILLAVGCAVGLGNVWRFPYITGQYGGALFVLFYFVFLIILGIPVMTVEFAVGRASEKSAAKSFHVLERPDTKWHLFSWAAVAGNYLLMLFYTTVAGWTFAYMFKTARGDFSALSPDEIGAVFANFTADPVQMVGWMALVCFAGYGICAGGLVAGVEKATKVIMGGLFLILAVLVVRSVTLPGASAGLAFFLKPNLDAVKEHGLFTVVFAAMGQAFFSLSIGIGSMAIFGSYINRNKRLVGEAITVTALDSTAAIMAGLVIFPACFAFGVSPDGGPGLVFITLPNIFNNMLWGRLWGSLFFLFMVFAAMSTTIAVFENTIAFLMETLGFNRIKSCIVNFIAVTALSIPCALGFNLLSGFQPFGPGSGVLDLLDFIVSSNLLPLGALVYVLFCVSKKGWGWDNFVKEANTGSGLALPVKLKHYFMWGLPVLIILIYILGYINKFFRGG